jgi:hypothetical protein
LVKRRESIPILLKHGLGQRYIVVHMDNHDNIEQVLPIICMVVGHHTQGIPLLVDGSSLHLIEYNLICLSSRIDDVVSLITYDVSSQVPEWEDLIHPAYVGIQPLLTDHVHDLAH